MRIKSELGAFHIIGILLLLAVLMLIAGMSRYSENIGSLRQEEFSNQQKIADLEKRIRILETRALQERIHENTSKSQ
jgi:hypothetical protein